MFVDAEYQRRMASLARAEAGRSGEARVSPFAAIALARRLQEPKGQRFGVDPVAASAPDPKPLLLRG